MKVLLVRPKPSPDSVGLMDLMVCEPLELEYVYAAIQEAGDEPLIADMMLERTRLEAIVGKFNPDLIGFTSYITHVDVVKAYARTIKEVWGDIPTIVGGLHCEVNPDDFVDENVDFIAHRNGVATILEVIEHLKRGATPEAIVAAVPGLWDGNAERIAAQYPPELPRPDRRSTRSYRAHYSYLFHDNCALLKTSYGCPYPCDFCFCRVMTHGSYTERPLDDVVDELLGIEEENVFIVDDNFLMKRDRVEQFCDMLETHDIRKRYILFGRVDFIVRNPDLVERFASLGLHAVFIGVESFRQEDLDDYQKRCSVETSEAAARLLHSFGVEPYAGIVIGHDWHPQDFKGLSAWMLAHGLELANIQPLTPLPGTPCYERFENDLVVDANEHSKFDLTHLVVRPLHMSNRRFYTELIRTYYRTTANFRTVLYIWRRYGTRIALRMVKGGTRITWQYLKLAWKG